MSDSSSAEHGAPQAGKYNNFRDPFGLLKRMILSGNRAAYGALMRAGLSVAATPLDWALQFKERKLLEQVSLDEPAEPQILIVGPPRSGSTLLYQTMARYADVSYLSNLSDMFPRAPLTASRLLRRRRNETKKNFSNYYGQTAGLGSPNDGFSVWNRWLGRDRYFTPEELKPEEVNEMRRFFAAWSQQFGKPFLNKNNRNAFCMQLLAETLPAARFVIIRRDPIFVAQSLIKARAQVQGSKDRPWGLASTEDHSVAHEPLGYVNDVCDQLIKIKNRLQQQQAGVDPARYVEITYESFCKNPQDELLRIDERIGPMQLDRKLMADELVPFVASTNLQLLKEEQEQIERRFAAIPAWHINTEVGKVKEAP